MSQSLSKIYIHAVFHTKYNAKLILPEDDAKLYAYMGSIIKDNDSIPIIINGVENHVHLLFIMSKNIALAKIMEEIKKHSSRWIKTLSPHYANFKWQGGYGGFSVSSSVVERTKEYIKNQKTHHQKKDYKDEYVTFLKEYGIDYNDEYLWAD